MTQRIFLGLVAAMFLAFGFWSIAAPAAMTAQLGVEAGGPAGLFEMRGVFGGVSLGAGLLCAAGAARAAMARPALWFIVAYMGGYVLGRAASLLAGDAALPASWAFAGLEALLFLTALGFLLRKA